MLNLTGFECRCQYGVKNGYITARWVGECCSGPYTPIAILCSDTKNIFVGTF